MPPIIQNKEMKLKYYWKSVLMTAVILYLSFARLSPIEQVPQFSYTDKVAHFMLYLIYSLFLMFDYLNTGKRIYKKRFYSLCLIWPVILGAVTEICQSLFFAPRQSEWLDFLSNVTGVLVGWGIFHLFRKQFIKT